MNPVVLLKFPIIIKDDIYLYKFNQYQEKNYFQILQFRTPKKNKKKTNSEKCLTAHIFHILVMALTWFMITTQKNFM